MDDVYVVRNCRAAQDAGHEIDDATARVIASWWHDGAAGYEFTSTGTVNPRVRRWLSDTIVSEYTALGEDDRLALDMLGTYMFRTPCRGPVPGWSALWVRS